MIKYLIFIFTFLAGVISAQENDKFVQFSLFGGIQNPIEIALLDFNGTGPADDFRVGPSVGLSLERSGKRFGLKFSSLYLNNSLKSIAWYQYKGSLHTSYNKAELTLRLNSKDSPVRFKMGLGGGILFNRVPSIFIKYGFVTDDGLTEQTFPAENVMTLALCSFVNIEIPINQKWSFISLVSTDAAWYYGEIETAILINGNVGIAYNFGQSIE